MTKKTMTEIVSAIVAQIEPLSSEERHRAIHASLTIVGETSGKQVNGPEKNEGDEGNLPGRAQSWMKQNNLSNEQLYQVFHRGNDGFEVIVSEVPGKNNRERVRNAYVLLGVACLFSTGVANFDDKSARALCEKLGVYDQTNHMKYMKGGNEFTGSKDKGWTLTAPGFKRGAALIAELAK